MFTIGQAARLSGVSIETIRYYERRGVVPAPERSPAGRRLYDDAAMARLRFVRRCRNLGFSLSDVRVLLSLADRGEGSCAEVKYLGERHLEQVRDKIGELVRLESSLGRLVGQCEDDRPECPALRELLS